MASQAADPISAIANALGSLYEGIGNVWTSIVKKKIVKEEGKNLDKLTVLERIKYNEAIQQGNIVLASKMLDDAQNKDDSNSLSTGLIIGASFLIVLVIVYLKNRQS
jgi:hypothetical protein